MHWQVDWLSALGLYGAQIEYWVLLSSVPLKVIAVRQLAGRSLFLSTAVGVGMGLVSATLTVRFPAGVVLWLVGPGCGFGAGSADPGNWIGMLIATALVSTGADVLLLRLLFKSRLSHKSILSLAAINAACLVTACYETMIYAEAHPPEAFTVPPRESTGHAPPPTQAYRAGA